MISTEGLEFLLVRLLSRRIPRKLKKRMKRDQWFFVATIGEPEE